MITVTNQKPVKLDPVYNPIVSGDYNPLEYLQSIVTTPILSSKINQNKPISITDSNSSLTFNDDQDIIDLILACSEDFIDPVAEQVSRELFGKTLTYFDQQNPLTLQELFPIQSANKESLPYPSSNVLYVPDDVIASSKLFLSGDVDFDYWFANLSFYARPDTLGFHFATENDFDDFKEWLKTEINLIQSVLPIETNQMFADFNKLTLNNLTESILLRNEDDEATESYSFARCIVYYLMKYTNRVSIDIMGVLPFRLDELVNPKSIVFVNVEKHAHATKRKITKEWDIINQSLQNKPKIINLKKLTKLTATRRSMSKAMQSAQYNLSRQQQQIQRAQKIKFSNSKPTTLDLIKRIKKVMNKMAQVNRSENSFKDIKSTYQKPNRRDPDDFNKPGKVVSTKYKPDIHLYIDTSGSISEENYKDAIKACIKMAKKLNINLYFNSFSHVLSQATKLETKDKSQSQIYKEFQNVPKVTGGTDYEQIWHYINRSKKRQRELSIIMTDFEWYAPNRFVKHPNNLYYIPISVDSRYWNYMTQDMESFCKSMKHIDIKIRSKILC